MGDKDKKKKRGRQNKKKKGIVEFEKKEKWKAKR
jgi:hypothetical protein